MSDFAGLFRKLLDEETEKLTTRLDEQFGVGAVHDSTPLPTITVRQATGYLPISMEMAMDAGLMTEAEARARGWTPAPPPPPIPWRTKARWRWQSWRERAGRKVGGWLAGVDLTERDEEW